MLLRQHLDAPADVAAGCSSSSFVFDFACALRVACITSTLNDELTEITYTQLTELT
jgi:hypothetical protein